VSQSVRDRRRRLELISEAARDAIGELQQQCDHSGEVTYKYAGSSGNWSKSDDEYWMEWHCMDCGKHWTTSQDNAYELTTKTYPRAQRIS